MATPSCLWNLLPLGSNRQLVLPLGSAGKRQLLLPLGSAGKRQLLLPPDHYAAP